MTKRTRAKELSALTWLLSDFGDLKVSEALAQWRKRLRKELGGDVEVSTAVERLRRVAHQPPKPKKQKRRAPLKWGPSKAKAVYVLGEAYRQLDKEGKPESDQAMFERVSDALTKIDAKIRERLTAELAALTSAHDRAVREKQPAPVIHRARMAMNAKAKELGRKKFFAMKPKSIDRIYYDGQDLAKHWDLLEELLGTEYLNR